MFHNKNCSNLKHTKMKKVFKYRGFKSPLWEALGNDKLRPVLQHAYIDNGYIVCTDAHILVKQSLRDFHQITDFEIECLNGKFLNPEFEESECFGMIMPVLSGE